MKRFAWIYIAVEANALALYWLTLFDRMNAKSVGLYAFPGSPDWSFLYWQSHVQYMLLAGPWLRRCGSIPASRIRAVSIQASSVIA